MGPVTAGHAPRHLMARVSQTQHYLTDWPTPTTQDKKCPDEKCTHRKPLITCALGAWQGLAPLPNHILWNTCRRRAILRIRACCGRAGAKT